MKVFVASILFASMLGFGAAVQRSVGVDDNVASADDLSASCLANKMKVSRAPDVFLDEETKKVLSAVNATGNRKNMHHIFHKMQRGQDIRVMAFGGSFTKGEACEQTIEGGTEVRGRDCSWVARTLRWWQTAFPKAKLTFDDHARSSTTSAAHLSTLGTLVSVLPKAPDLILIDTLANDAIEPLRSIPWQQRGITDPEAREVSMEAFVRTLQELLPDAQLLMVEDGCPGTCLNNAHYHTRVAEHYNIPMVNFAAMVTDHNKLGVVNGSDRLWPQQHPEFDGAYVKMGAEWPNFLPKVLVEERSCCPGEHPPWPTHQNLAGAVASAITSLLEETCEEAAKAEAVGGHRDATLLSGKAEERFIASLAPEGTIEKFLVCKEPAVLHSAAKGDSPQSGVVLAGDWTLSTANASWVAGRKDSTIRFPVKIGSYPSIGIQWTGQPRATLRLFQTDDESKASQGRPRLFDDVHVPKYFGPGGDKKDANPESTQFTFFDVSQDAYLFWPAVDRMACEPSCPQDYTLEITMTEDAPLAISRVSSC